MNYTDVNSKTVDSWVEEGWEWGTPISSEVFAAAKCGEWDVFLTPLKPVPEQWFLPFIKPSKRLDGTMILGLASGGGQQMPIFTASGAVCTVFDYSQKQLDNEADVARREDYQIEIKRGDMTKPLPFADNSFDLIFHPVSNCYVEDIEPIWHECYRVLKPGGVLLTGMMRDIVYIFDEDDPLKVIHKLPYNPLKDSELYKKCIDGNWGITFSHTLEQQIGGQLRAGFVLSDLYTDGDNQGGVADFMSTCMATRAVKPEV